MNRDLSLIQFAERNKAIISVVKDRVAVWILGYVLYSGPIARKDISESLTVSERENLTTSIQNLIEAELIRERENGIIVLSEKGARLANILGFPSQLVRKEARLEISCDVFTIKNAQLVNGPIINKRIFIEQLIKNPQLFMQGPEGARYGFVECKTFGDDTLFGYFTQEYLAHSLKYDQKLQRQEDWSTKNYNILFILPLNSQALILQDAKFYGVPSLSMATTKSKIQMLLTILFDHHGINRTGDLILKPYERVLTKGEMLEILLKNEQPVTQAQMDLGNVTYSLPENLPVFNPRYDWNEILTKIINDFELPNVANAIFTSTRVGNLSKSMLVKALALAGQIKRVKLGRGKNSRIVKKVVPTHVGRVPVSDPVTIEDVVNILAFLQNQLGLTLSSLPLSPSKETLQIRFEI